MKTDKPAEPITQWVWVPNKDHELEYLPYGPKAGYHQFFYHLCLALTVGAVALLLVWHYQLLSAWLVTDDAGRPITNQGVKK
jgi:hypothetical protein